MRFTWSATKAVANLAKHGVALEAVELLDWDTVLVSADVRFDYPEPRLIALGLIGPRVYVVVYTIERRSVRVISLRKASPKESRRYERES
jgi:uncharacterized DUF497 family protein